VAGGQDESISIGPGRIGWIVLQMACPEGEGGRRGSQRETGMAGLGPLDGVAGQEAKRVHALDLCGLMRGCHVVPLEARDADRMACHRPPKPNYPTSTELPQALSRCLETLVMS